MKFQTASLLIALTAATSAHAEYNYELNPKFANAVKASYFIPTVDTASSDWKILRTSWSDADEKRFSQFVEALGKTNCRSTDACLKSAANPYRSTDPAGVRYYADCADLPYILRGYFAWKNGLPFGHVTEVALQPGTPPPADPLVPTDLRYSPIGNTVVARRTIVSKKNAATGVITRVKAPTALRNLSDVVSSAFYRIGALNEKASNFSEFYSPALTRASVKPGTVIYDPAGHVALVYSVETDGRILFMDAHPDNSLTRGTYGQKFARSRPGQGAGFKNWRPMKLTGGVQDPSGEWLGGQLELAAETSIPDFSLEQYVGNRPNAAGIWNRGLFYFGETKLPYYDYVRHVLSSVALKYNPLNEFSLLLKALCTDVQDRIHSVDYSVANQTHLKTHPTRLPENIYGTSGEWENYATPSRDARLKVSFREAYERAEEFMKLSLAQDPSLDYAGMDLKSDLRTVLNQETTACILQYQGSDGAPYQLALDQISANIYDLSFDPYDCPELRWGDLSKSARQRCTNDEEKNHWYRALRKLRNQADRTYDVRMDYTRDELEAPSCTLGVESPLATNLIELLK